MADPTPETLEPHNQASRHDPVYDRLHETAEFTELRRRYRGFVFPWTVAFLSWYLLYVVMSNWALCIGHVTIDAFSLPWDRGPFMWPHLSSTA